MLGAMLTIQEFSFCAYYKWDGMLLSNRTRRVIFDKINSFPSFLFEADYDELTPVIAH
jgi:hypothetical protein